MGACGWPEPPTPSPVPHLGPTGSASHTHLYNGSNLLSLLPQLLLIYLGRGKGQGQMVIAA